MITIFEMASGQEDVVATHKVEVAHAASAMTNPAVKLRLLTLDEAVAVEQRIAKPKVNFQALLMIL
ncbi:hypothetical protein [Chitinimonas sp. BJB300]|uniref:hypothetical protein n=1 Tax=Chitinimonas sp. BJB300 TaxID=1559339 RepID=UPI000C0ECF44|nr:hypothetical protein [Chitinimonas sp. BJB300]PHV12579.1 hypothetical protein CSQ89_05160 [Chitinimonas sp. BJB300]TSJ90028.1 hypothetical protein FG002_007515 [Chitinimonas sp. BJB300]